MSIRIQVLGRFSVSQDGKELTRFSDQPTRAALLLYLAMERDVTRDAAEGVIWSDLPPDRARHSLNQTLYRLRKDLGEDWLSTEGDRLRVSEDLRVDALDFEEKVEAGDLPGALALYEGGFLEGWHLLDISAFEHWTDRHRIRQSRLHREACRSRLSHLKEAGKTDGGLELVRAWIQRDPLEDEAHHALIELLAMAGERSEALARFEAYEKLLADEGLTPLDETRKLVEGLREGRAPRSASMDPVDGFGSSPSPTGGVISSGGAAPSGVRKFRPMWALGVAVPLILAGLFLFAMPRSPDSAVEPVVNRVLVFPLDNQSGDPSLEPVGRMAADWITQGLAGAEFLQVVPFGELVLDVGSDPDGNPTPDHDAAGRRAAEDAGAGTLVSGRFYASGDGLEFHVQILELPGWELLESVGPVRSSTMDPIEAVDVLRQRVLISLAVHRNETFAGIYTPSARPPTYPAYLAFVEGGRKMSMGDWRGAATDLMRANELAPEFTAPLIYAGFAVINGWRDYAGADSLAQILEASKETLPRYDRLRLELLQATLAGDNPRAYLAVREAAELSPGGSAHFSAGNRAVGLNRPREGLEILSTWDPTRTAVRQWTPYWRVVTTAYHMLGDHEKELEVARRGRRLIPDRLETLMYEVRALAALGRISEVMQLLDESLRIRSSPQWNPGLVMYRAATELHTHHFLEAADTALTRLRAWLDDLDAETAGRRDLRLLGARALYLEDRLEPAREAFLDLVAEEPGDPTCLRNLGAIAARIGDRRAAMEYDRALASLDRPYLFGEHTFGRAVIAAILGEEEQALSLLQTSLSQGVYFGPGLLADPDLALLGDYPPFVEFIRPKG
jgi:DNA-binding SARP family transcriptional activator/tetratricopeptide (TPR) repeat protein